jgi:phosphoribosyl 1,2-cyclic phosphodiesterase
MRLIFWGTRGSIANPAPNKVRHGANTACVSVQVGDDRIILDAGIGIVMLGDRILEWRLPKERLHLHLFLSHLHWDHVIGLPFFIPVFFKNIELSIWGRNAVEVESAIERLFTSTYSPIKGTKNLGARLHYRTVGDAPATVGPFTVTAAPLRHPAGSLAYRLEAGNKAVVYASDHEAGDPDVDRELVALARGADVLIHDAQWSAEQQAERGGFGHSTWQQALACAQEAGVKTLVLFHHHHRHSDDTLDDIGRAARAAAPAGLEIIVARDGLVLDP